MRALPLYALGGGVAIDPALLTLTGWWRGSYTGAPWECTASAGNSASHALASSGSDPSVGTAVNGFTPADFDGAFNYMLGAASGGGALTFDNFITAGAGTIVALVKPAAAAADAGAGNRISNPGILAQEGGATTFGLGYSDAGLTVAFYDTSLTYQELAIASPVGSWAVAQLTWDGALLRMRVNGGAWSSIACANMSDPAINFNAGKNFDVGLFQGQMVEIMTAQSAMSTSTLDGIRGYLRSRYALSSL